MPNKCSCLLCVTENNADEGSCARNAVKAVKCFDTIMTDTEEALSSENMTFKKKKTKQLRKRTSSSEESNHSEEEEEDNDFR